MTRILLIETASPRRVRLKAEEILAAADPPAPELTILCQPEAQIVEYFSALPEVNVLPLEWYGRRQTLEFLRQAAFDVSWWFWTGDEHYFRMKRFAWRVPARSRHVDIGDGNSFKLGRGNVVRYLFIRGRHPKPADAGSVRFDSQTPDGAAIAAPHYQGERILILQSAEPHFIVRALERMKEQPLFQKPRYTVFCRNRREVLKVLQDHPMVHSIIRHSETRGALNHLRDLRRAHFDGVVVFFTGDPSYWKIKYFAFLLGARHKVVFNESNDCFFFNMRSWLSLLARRLEHKAQAPPPERAPRTQEWKVNWRFSPALRGWIYPARLFAISLTKLALMPFRWLWLLLVWVWLRGTNARITGG